MAIAAQDVIDQAIDLVEMEQSSGEAGFAVRERVQNMFNQGLAKLHYTLADGDLDWHAERATISVTAGTSQYQLPNGTLYSSAPQFYKLKALYLVKNSKLYVVPKYQEQEISGWEDTGPQSNETLRMTYIPAYVPITPAVDWSSTNIAYPYPPGWEDYVACFIARRLSIRDENYERAEQLRSERDQALLSVMQHVSPRDVGRPDRVVDVSGRFGNDYQFAWTPAFRYRLFGDYLEIGQPGQLP